MGIMNIYKKRSMYLELLVTVSEILTVQICVLQIVGQGHRVKLLQCCHSMANIKSKTLLIIYALALALAVSAIAGSSSFR